MSEQNHHSSFLKNVRVDLIICLVGFSAMVGQVLLLRRFIAVFGGNELVIGAVFFGWVFWAGLGNLAAGRIADRVADIPHLMSLVINLTALLLPATVLIASMAKVILGYPPPQLVGIPVVALVTITILAPFCFMVGAGLTIAAKLPATGRARDIGVMYLFDALGAGIGGLVATWFAIRAYTSFQVAVMASLLLIFFNAALLVRKVSTQVLTATIGIVAVFTLWLAPGIHLWSVKHIWAGYNPIVDIDSRYGNLVVTEQGTEHTLFFDGVPQFSTPLPETYETSALLPLLMHPDPRDVLVIGGGISGMLANWRNVALDSIVYLQVDPDVTRLERTVMAADNAMEDKHLEILHADAPLYLRKLDHKGCTKECFDVIIINAGDPDTAVGSRLLTETFFARAHRALRPDGVISFGIFEPGNAIGPEAAQLLGTMRATLGEIFENVVVLPFDRFYFFGSPYDKYLTDDPAMIRERIAERNIVAPTLESQQLASIFPERIQSMNAVITEAAVDAPTNTERKPAAYFTGLMLWASRTRGVALKMLYMAKRISWPWLAAMLIVAAAASILVARTRTQRSLRLSSFWILFSIGFGAIIYQIVLLIHYQMQFGLLFYQIGIIITAFMVGLSLGAYTSIRVFQRVRIRTIYLIAGLLIFAAYQPLLFAASSLSFTLANLVCGIMEGFLFEATAEWMIASREEIGHTAGWLNCADYWGSAVGAILASIIAVPLFGLVPSVFIAAALPFTAAVVIASSSPEWKSPA